MKYFYHCANYLLKLTTENTNCRREVIHGTLLNRTVRISLLKEGLEQLSFIIVDIIMHRITALPSTVFFVLDST